uniref:Uncharacterized protein n=1 Tax=Eutreptiella gymnastica TaxID=73025 RepID=A0A6U8AM91_9EUGL|mmetsp:Transcript_1681/g.3288  ORF Transcript_1681/g.3288 Transcript_1681/m.3288 type:complete len:109 (+) Transcript_1681:29-355(+)
MRNSGTWADSTHPTGAHPSQAPQHVPRPQSPCCPCNLATLSALSPQRQVGQVYSQTQKRCDGSAIDIFAPAAAAATTTAAAAATSATVNTPAPFATTTTFTISNGTGG